MAGTSDRKAGLLRGTPLTRAVESWRLLMLLLELCMRGGNGLVQNAAGLDTFICDCV